jgi:hypothetical protein
VLVDEKTVLCQFKARSATAPSSAPASMGADNANNSANAAILQGFFISRVEKRYVDQRT